MPKKKKYTVYSRKYEAQPENRDKRRKAYLLRVYGITTDQYDELLVKQEHKCAICLRPSTTFQKRLNVDHSHTAPGYIRGLLCPFCNRGLSHFRDDPEYFKRASIYLRQNTGWTVPEKYLKGSWKKGSRKRKKKI